MSSVESQPPGRRRDDRRERTRERLLAAAVEVLRREGLGALNVSRIAKDVGVHPPREARRHIATVALC